MSHSPVYRDAEASGRPNLKVFSREMEVETERAPMLSPRITLADFFERWFLPVILQGEHDAGHSTVRLYRESIAWWVKLTRDPPLELIDDYVISNFQQRLREGQYRRGRLGAERTLSKYTVAKHLRNLRAVLSRTGPTVDPQRPGKGLVDEAPRIKIGKLHASPKPCFSLEQARRVVANGDALRTPQWPGIPPAHWWRAFLSLLFYTGLRVGTVLKLRWSLLEQRDDGWWVRVPQDLVPKTEKAIDRPIHDLAAAAIESIRGQSELLVPWPHSYSHLGDQHDALQLAAGIGRDRWFELHAWRRTYADQMARLGLRYAEEVARRSLDHADTRTTTDHYVSIEAELMRRLPALWTPGDDRRQRRLF